MVMFMTYTKPLVTAFDSDELTIPLTDFYEEAKKPDILLILDVFEIQSKDPNEIVKALGARNEERDEVEHHMAMLYFWARGQLRLLSPHGTLGMPKPAPLSAEEMSMVLKQLAHSKQYQHQTVVGLSKERRQVVMKNGVCVVEEGSN